MANTALNRFLQQDLEDLVNLFDGQLFKNQKHHNLKGSLLYQPDTFCDSTDTQHSIDILVPGYNKEDIKLEFKADDIVTIESNIPAEQRKPYQKNFKLSIYVPSKKWNYETAEARLNQGVLNITFQAKEVATFPQITIK
jgi:HSP20 family molecular chaperone IbpA